MEYGYGPRLPREGERVPVWEQETSSGTSEEEEEEVCKGGGEDMEGLRAFLRQRKGELRREEADAFYRKIRAVLQKRERLRLNRERRETMKELREYQWYQNAWSEGETRLEATKVRMQTDEEKAWAAEVRSEDVKFKQAEAAAEKLLEAMSKVDLFGSDEAVELWTSHEKAWEAFEARDDAAPVSYEEVPWPPVTSELLSAMAAAEITKAKGGEKVTPDSKEAFVAHKRAFKRAHLRWHPDKFMHRFGKALDGEDAERIRSKVQEISQAINVSWSTIEGDF